jgi:hypothetical protein
METTLILPTQRGANIFEVGRTRIADCQIGICHLAHTVGDIKTGIAA